MQENIKPLNPTEAVIGGFLWKKVFLKISQNIQEDICARLSFLIKFIKKETLAQVFSCKFYKSFKRNLYDRTPPDDCF